MRELVIVVMLAGAQVSAAAGDYVEVRHLELDAAGIDTLSIDTGSGPLTVIGDPDADRIVAAVTIKAKGSSDAAARKRIEKDLVLELERQGSLARFKSETGRDFFGWRDSLGIEIEVRVPGTLAVTIEDGSGSIEALDIGGALRVEDGSGPLMISGSGSDITVEDGSGAIEIDGAGGDVRVVDGSGSITIRRVAGSVFIDDGSGSIRVDDVTADLIVEDAGSGSINYSSVQGRVSIDE